MKQKFNVTGMTCTACSAHVEKAVNGVQGVESCNVNLLGNSMLVEYDDETNAQAIIRAVEEAGYGASLPAQAGKAAAAPARPTDAMAEEAAGMGPAASTSCCRRILTSLPSTRRRRSRRC